MEIYDRVWRVLRIPQIMGWWGIVLIQQTIATETELPFWRKRRSQLFPEYWLKSNGSYGRCVGLLVIFWGVGDLTVLRFWGFYICECIKIPASEIVRHIHKSPKVIIIVTSNQNTQIYVICDFPSLSLMNEFQ